MTNAAATLPEVSVAPKMDDLPAEPVVQKGKVDTVPDGTEQDAPQRKPIPEINWDEVREEGESSDEHKEEDVYDYGDNADDMTMTSALDKFIESESKDTAQSEDPRDDPEFYDGAEDNDASRQKAESKNESRGEGEEPASKTSKEGDADTPEVDERLIALAKNKGINEATARKLGNEDLTNLLQANLSSELQANTGEAAPEDDTKGQEQAEESKPYLFDETKLDFLDPEIRDEMNAMSTHYHERLGALEKVIQQQNEMVDRIHAQDFYRRFDETINDMGDDVTALLGKGYGATMDRNSPEFMARQAVADQLKIIHNGYKQTGKPIPGDRQLIQQAINSVFGDQLRTNASKSVAQQLDRRKGSMAARPAPRKKQSSKRDPDERALDTIGAFIDGEGYATEDTLKMYDGFLD